MAGRNSMTTVEIGIDSQRAIKRLDELKQKVDTITDSISKLAEKMKNPDTWDASDTKSTLEAKMKKLQSEAEKALHDYEFYVQRVSGIDDMLKNIGGANYNTLTQLRSTLTAALKNRKRETEDEIKAYEETAKRLQKVRDEIAERDIDVRGSMTVQKAQEVLAKPESFSTKSINDAIAALTKFRDMQETGSTTWKHWNGYVLNGTKYLETFSSQIKQMQMEDLHLKLYEANPSISDNDLATLSKYWESMAAGADKGSQELAYYNKLLEEAQKLTQQRVAKKAGEVMASPGDYSVDEINQAIEATKKLQAAQQPGSAAWSTYGREIENARQVLERFNAEAKETAMSDRLSSLATASTSSLTEQKKYWQEMVNATDTLNPKLQEYKNNLQQVIHEEQYRSRMAAESVISQVHGGQWQRTIGDTQEAIKQLKEYRTMMDTADAPGLKRIDEAIASLSQQLKEAEAGYLSVAEAMSQANDAGEGNFDGTLEDLEKLKKRLEEIRQKEIRLGSPDAEEQIKRIDEAIAKVKQRINAASEEAIDFEKVLKDPKAATFKELEATAKQLEEELKNCVKGTDEFIDKSASLREVNKQLKDIKSEWKEQESIIAKTAKRLASYILVYAGWNEIWGKAKEAFQENLKLSDSLADIQKTTGLSADSVSHLSDEINRIDTRTAQEELHELAYEAGKLGISAEEDVLAFVRAGNQLLVALGEDLGGAEAVRSLMKVNAVLGETQKLGVEKALLSTGSAINEISQTSRASAGPIADMVARIGAIGAAANLGMADLIALAGTADAMGQSAEISGTAFNKFISTLQTNTVDVAYALGLDPERLQELMSSGETMQAIVEIFEKMNLKEDMSKLAPIMGELGSEGARMTQVLTTMAAGVEELKSQMYTSNQAFKDAVSVTNEYNIKNESAAAIMQRMGNNMREYVVNSGFVEFIKDVLQNLYYLPNVLERNRLALYMVRAVMWEIVTVSGVKFLTMIGKSMVAAWGNLTKTVTWHNAVAAARLIRTASGVQKLSIAFKALAIVIKANPILSIGSALAGVITAIHHFTEETNKAARASAEYNAAIRKEQFELENLLSRINRANAANGEKAALIKELNNKYGQYLGFLVTEQNYLGNQEYIYKLLNKQIERSIALKMQEKLVSDISAKYADKQLDAYEDINRALVNIKGIGEGGVRGAVSSLMESIKEQAQNGSIDVSQILISTLRNASEEFEKEYIRLQTLMKNEGKSQNWFEIELRKAQNRIFGGANITSLEHAIEDMLEVETAIANEANKAAKLTDSNINSIENQIKKIKQVEVEDIAGNIGNEKDVNSLKEYKSKVADYLRLRKEEAKMLTARQTEQNNLTQTELEQLQAINEEITIYQRHLDQIEGKLAAVGELSIWGDGKTVKDMDVNQLVAKYKQLESDGRKIGTNAAESIQTTYWKGFDDQKKAIKWYRDQAEEIKKELESRGYNTSGKFKWGSSSEGRDAKKKVREEYKAAMSALDAYYKEREALIREEGVKENKLQSTIDAQLASNQAAWKKDKVELIKMLLGDVSEFDPFDNEGYMGAITQNIFFGKGRDKSYLQNLAQQLSAFGLVLEDGMRNTLSSALVDLGKVTETEVERMKKILLQDDFTEQVAKQYMESLDTLGLLFGIAGSEMSEGDAELGRQRLEAMREYADKAYSLTAEQLETEMMQNSLFDAWRIGRKREHYEVLLNELRKFHDDQEEADRKSAERREKILKNSLKGRNLIQENADRIRNEEEDVKMWDRFKEMNLVTDDTVDRAQIDVYQAKIDASNAWIRQIELQMSVEKKQLEQEMINAQTQISLMKLRGEDASRMEAELVGMKNRYLSLNNQQEMMTLQYKEEIADAEKEIADRRISIQQRLIGDIQKGTDALVQFAYDAAYAEVDADAQIADARNELIKSLLTSLKDWAQIKLTELTMNAIFGQQRLQQEATETGASMSLDAAKAEGKVAAATVAATAEETITKGLVGLAVGAVIGAALNALLGAALGKLNKKKSEVESIGGTGGKLATGMLTYASGNYPVLGNDGKVYNAQYEGPGMKTGIYRGGAHFGIFSEKKPEAIIDGDTTQRLIMNHPDIWKAIVTLSKNGRLDSGMGMRTFASGNMADFPAQGSGTQDASGAAQMLQMQSVIDNNSRVMNQLAQLLAGGIHAEMDMYGSNGAYSKMEKARKFMSRRK